VAKNNLLSTKQILLALRSFLKSDFGIALIIAITWQILMTIFGVLGEVIFSDKTYSIATTLSHTGNWDGGWYQFIINGGYFKNNAAPAFFPLFPMAVRCLQVACFGLIDVLTAGFIINLTSTWLAITALVKIADFFVSKKYRWWVVAIFITSPVAIFLHMFYSEAIFCAIGFWAYLFALKRRWALVGITLAILTSARIPAILFVGLCGLEFMKTYEWNIKKIFNPKLLWFLLAPIGFIAYATFLYAIKGNALAMFSALHSTNDWSYHIFNPNFVLTIAHQVSTFVKIAFGIIPFNKSQIIDIIMPLLGLIILGLASLYAVFTKHSKRLLPLGLFGLVSIIFFTLNSNIVSVHRYLLPVLVIYIVSVTLVEKYNKLKPVFYVVICGDILLQAYLLILFVSGRFAG
jgi:Gpi18-like mannosyltransferase